MNTLYYSSRFIWWISSRISNFPSHKFPSSAFLSRRIQNNLHSTAKIQNAEGNAVLSVLFSCQLVLYFSYVSFHRTTENVHFIVYGSNTFRFIDFRRFGEQKFNFKRMPDGNIKKNTNKMDKRIPTLKNNNSACVMVSVVLRNERVLQLHFIQVKESREKNRLFYAMNKEDTKKVKMEKKVLP